MSFTSPSSGKEKGRVIDLTAGSEDHLQLNSDSNSSTSDSDSDLSDTDSDVVTPEYLESLLEKARRNYAAAAAAHKDTISHEGVELEEQIIKLDGEQPPLPPLDPGILPPPYFDLSESRLGMPPSILDPDVELAERASSSRVVPEPPVAPPELTRDGKPLTKRQQKELKNQTAGPDWFDLPAPPAADLPRLHREVEALRLHNQLDPKRFYRKDEGEGKGIKGLPKYFAVGTIVPASTPFGTTSGDNLTRANRKRTLVDELVDDAEAKHYAKKKFNDLQAVRGARGRNTLHAKRAMRRGKW